MRISMRLAQLAETIGVEFEFRGFMANSLANLQPKMLDLRPLEVETVTVNLVFELHRLLACPGGIKAMKPKIVTIVESRKELEHCF